MDREPSKGHASRAYKFVVFRVRFQPHCATDGASRSRRQRGPGALERSRRVGLHDAIPLGLHAVRTAVHARRGGRRRGVRVRVLSELRLALGGCSLGPRRRSPSVLRARAGAFRLVRPAVVPAAPAGAPRFPRIRWAPAVDPEAIDEHLDQAGRAPRAGGTSCWLPRRRCISSGYRGRRLGRHGRRRQLAPATRAVRGLRTAAATRIRLAAGLLGAPRRQMGMDRGALGRQAPRLRMAAGSLGRRSRWSLAADSWGVGAGAVATKSSREIGTDREPSIRHVSRATPSMVALAARAGRRWRWRGVHVQALRARAFEGAGAEISAPAGRHRRDGIARRHRRAPRWSGNRDADRHRHGEDAGRRPAHERGLPRRADGPSGRGARGDRPPPVPGGARPGRRAVSTRPRHAQGRPRRSRPVPEPVRAGRDPEATARRPGGARPAARGNRQVRRGSDPERQGEPGLLPDHVARVGSGRAPAGGPGEHRTDHRHHGARHDHAVAAHDGRLQRGRGLPASDPGTDPPRSQAPGARARPGTAEADHLGRGAHARQPDRYDDRHRQGEGDLSQRRPRPFSQSVRQRATARRRAPPSDAGPRGRGPAQRARRVRVPRQTRPDRFAAAGFGGHDRRRQRRNRQGAEPRRRHRHRQLRQAAGRHPHFPAEDGCRGIGREHAVNLSRPFILRPVATSLFMAAIVLAGAVAFRQLPVSALPEVDYPTIQVLTFFPGASPDVMASAVTAPLERQFGQVPGLNQMTSTSSGGSSLITLQFSLDLDIDVAAQEVQAAINAAQTFLPADLPSPPIYSKTNPADTPVLTLALTSNALPLSKVQDLADTRLAQKISQLPGVGLVTISGGQKPAVRVQANPTALSSYGVNLDDVRTALQQASINRPKGNFDGPHQSYQVGANDQLLTSKEYRSVVVAFRNGAPVMLSDVATVIDGVENVNQAAWMNNVPAVIVNIQRQPGANIIQVVDRIKTLLPQLNSTLPSSIQVSVLTDRTLTIRASVADVQFELMLTVTLVVLVIFLFLRNVAATIIPSIAVPLSLVGTFAVMYLLGYSLNNLTLMALTISTGFVVDDAIVMIENIVRYIEEGENPLAAALKGAEQIGFTIVSLMVSLIAVLIPLLFMGDIVGRLFREFAITLSVTILVSAVVSLTLTPMMCSKLLRHKPEATQGRFYLASERVFERVIGGYGKTLQWVLQHQAATLAVAVATLGLTVWLYIIVPKGFFPVQDTGVIQGISEAPQQISFTAMADKQQEMAAVILKDPAVESLSSFIGVDGTNTTLNSGRILVNLKPLAQRKATASEIVRR